MKLEKRNLNFYAGGAATPRSARDLKILGMRSMFSAVISRPLATGSGETRMERPCSQRGDARRVVALICPLQQSKRPAQVGLLRPTGLSRTVSARLTSAHLQPIESTDPGSCDPWRRLSRSRCSHYHRSWAVAETERGRRLDGLIISRYGCDSQLVQLSSTHH